MLDRMLRSARRISQVAAWVSGSMLLVAAVMVATEIVIRRVFVATLGGTLEIASYLFAVSTAWGLTFTLFERAHVRIDALYRVLPTRLCAFLDVVALAFLGAFGAILTDRAITVITDSLRSGARSASTVQMPLAIPQALWGIGLAFFLLAIALLLARGATALVRGDVTWVQQNLGIEGSGEASFGEPRRNKVE